jgi:DNA-binding LacI/PurR family transcriptional regulator
VRVRIAELGELALERLLLGIAEKGRDKVSSQTLGTEVIVRSSCDRKLAPLIAIR